MWLSFDRRVGRCCTAGASDGQRLVEELLVAGLDPAPADEDPALVADEAVAVLPFGGGDEAGAVGVLVGDGEVVVAVVVVGEILGQLRADGVAETGPVSSLPSPHWAMSLWCAPQSVSLPPEYSYHQRNS